MSFIVNKTRAILSAVLALFFFVYGFYFLTRSDWLPALVFLAGAGLFGWIFTRNARKVSVSKEGIRLSFFGWKRQKTPWDQIQEMGLIGENVFSKKGKSGDKYIYFSPEKMTPDERFQMVVKWPPRKSIIYLEYSEKALEYCMSLWRGELMTYNVLDLFPNTGDPRGEKESRRMRS